MIGESPIEKRHLHEVRNRSMARALVGGLLGGGDENGVKRVNGSIGQSFKIVTRKELPLQPQREAPRVNAGTFSEVARAKHPQHMKQRDCLRKETQQRGLVLFREGERRSEAVFFFRTKPRLCRLDGFFFG